MRLRNNIRDWLARRLGVPRVDFALERLRTVGFRPQLVFDIGAYQGDFARMILENWPLARVACFEVQRSALHRLRQLPKEHVSVFECLLGSEPKDSVRLHLAETASSILTEAAAPQQQSASFPMRTVDDVIAKDFDGMAPSLLKLDVQGYELEVLRGAQESLNKIDVILAEVNLLDLHTGVPLLHELLAWLAERDWVAFDICGLTRRPLDNALWQADMIFVPPQSGLRMDKRWVSD